VVSKITAMLFLKSNHLCGRKNKNRGTRDGNQRTVWLSKGEKKAYLNFSCEKTIQLRAWPLSKNVRSFHKDQLVKACNGGRITKLRIIIPKLLTHIAIAL
jgi:hypothetical protein